MVAITTKRLCEQTGMTRETLRYYEAEGLMQAPLRASNGYRQYRPSDISRLQFIAKTKQAGFTLNEIKELLDIKSRGEATCAVGKSIAEQRIAQIDNRINSLKELREVLRTFADQCEAEGPDAPCSLSFFLDDDP